MRVAYDPSYRDNLVPDGEFDQLFETATLSAGVIRSGQQDFLIRCRLGLMRGEIDSLELCLGGNWYEIDHQTSHPIGVDAHRAWDNITNHTYDWVREIARINFDESGERERLDKNASQS